MIKRKPIQMTENDKKRFFEKVRIFTDDFGNEKWIWIGSLNKGYGQMRLGKTISKAHCIAWFIQHGEQNPPDKLHIRHMNHNKIDISPSNLELGTAAQNKMDGSFLNEADILDIRTSNLSVKELAKKYETTSYYINRIQVGEIYKSVHREHIRKPKFKYLSKEQIENIYKLSDEGLSQREIAYIVGCSKGSVSIYILKRKNPDE